MIPSMRGTIPSLVVVAGVLALALAGISSPSLAGAVELSDGKHECRLNSNGDPKLYKTSPGKEISFQRAIKRTRRRVSRYRRRMSAMRTAEVERQRVRRLKARIRTQKRTLREIRRCRSGELTDVGDAPPPTATPGGEEPPETSPTPTASPTTGSTAPGLPSDLSAGPVPTTADYYICNCLAGADSDCVQGLDANSGTTPQAPWQSYEQARQQFASLNPGEVIAFCQGGSFAPSSSTVWNNTSCLKNSPCTVRNYAPPWGSGDEGKPIITNTAGGVFDLSNPGYSQHEEGYTFSNLDLRGNDNGVGIFIYNDLDDLNLEFLAITGFQIGVQVAGSNPNHLPGSDGESKRIALYGSRIIDNSGQGWLGGCDDCVIEATYFENNGFAGPTFYHAIYWSDPNDTGTDRGIIKNNEIYRSTQQGGSCSGTPLVSHGVHSDLLIESNYVHEDPGTASSNCWGMTFDPAYSYAEGFRRLTIRGNRVEHVGNIGIGCASCSDTIIENNIVVQSSSSITAIAVPNRTREAQDEMTTNVTIRSNTVYITGNGGGTGILLGTEGSAHTVVSNALYYEGNSSSWNCFDLPLSASSYTAVDYNLCYFPNSSGNWEASSGSRALWNSATGFGANSLEEDPQFRSAALGQLEPGSATAPLVDNGHSSLSAANDVTGKARVQPDIGAYEY